MKKILVVLIFLYLGLASCEAPEEYDDSTTAKAEEFVAQMTLDEKVHLVVGPGMSYPDWGISAKPTINLIKDVAGVAGYINGVERLDIPALKLADGPAGLRIDPTREDNPTDTYYATSFPIATMLASTWDLNLVKKVGVAIGKEVKEYGVDFWLAPGLNIQRNPFCGRNFEYYSEDPLVSGKMAASMVKGVQSQKVGATLKHFVANNSETNRLNLDTIVTERALREIYLRGFQIAVEEAQPWAVMTSYNKLNGTYTSQSKDLIANILRKEWGFEGVVMTDWFAGDNPIAQQIAGNDLIMPGDTTFNPEATLNSEKLLTAVSNGELDQAIIDRSAINVMKQVLISPTYNEYNYSDTPDLDRHAEISRSAATDGMVLLENDGVLPILTSKKIASFGVGQIYTIKGGKAGSGAVHSAHTVSIAQGLNSEYAIDQNLLSYYETYIEENSYEVPIFMGDPILTCDESLLDRTEIYPHALENDVAVITIARMSSEDSDRTNTQGDFWLTDNEKALIENVSTAFHNEGKKVAVILNIGGPIEIASWKDNVDAILLAWQPGQEAGYAVADVLSGKVNPSGKLSQTFPVLYEDNPSSSTFPGVEPDEEGNPTKIYYNDDIYVGYRYYSTFGIEPLYEFGYGLSYTEFTYSDVRIIGERHEWNHKKKDVSDIVELAVKITNIGNVPGKEVVQVYVSAPGGNLSKPELELKAFAKTKLLPPKSNAKCSGSQTLFFSLDAKTLASFDTANDQWIVEPGEYKIFVSSSSDVSNIKPIKLHIKNKVIVSNTTPDAVAPLEEIKAMITQ